MKAEITKFCHFSTLQVWVSQNNLKNAIFNKKKKLGGGPGNMYVRCCQLMVQ
jgi:hypothetical protein